MMWVKVVDTLTITCNSTISTMVPHRTTKLLRDDPITKLNTQIELPPSTANLVPDLLLEMSTELNHPAE
jgi:hypothetical protein